MDFALDDTIAAIATAPGEAGLAVVRLSGPRTLAIAGEVFEGECLADAAGHTLHHGWLGGDERIEEVVAAVFRAPRSYTREDIVEFSCHGGDMPARAVLALLLSHGARLARPGEFTLRAFLNGRLDLLQAEAVAELIHARNEAMQRAALARLGGGLSRKLRAHLDGLADVTAEVEARVDFAEDVGGVEVPREIVTRIETAAAVLREHLRGAEWGRALRDGVPVTIVGRPNAGKSSLFNRLVGEERAIVTAIPGTTRDRVSASVEIRGALFAFSDTAGLRDGADEVEAIGVERTRQALAGSRIALWVLDGSRPVDAEDETVAAALAGKRVVVALNKRDLGEVMDATPAATGLSAERFALVRTCARTGEGLGELRERIAEVAGFEPGETLSSERQALTLANACEALERAAACARERQPGEIVALELREAMGALEELLGVHVSEDLLDRIFQRFCIGK